MIAAVLLAVLLGPQDTAIDPVIVIDADRPHVGTGPYVVARDEVQIEVGVQWQQSSEAGTFGSPALLRIGLCGRFEIRVSADGLLARHEAANDAYGLGNAQLGAKIRLLGSREDPFFSVMPTVNFGVASREKGLGNGATDVTLTWLVAREAVRGVHLEGNYGFGAIGDSGGRFTQHLITAAVVHQTTSKIQTYVESAWWSRQERGGSPVSFVDYGIIAAIRPRLLVDGGAFFGVTSSTPDWGVFSGVSFAFGGSHLDKKLRRGAGTHCQGSVLPAQYH